MDIKTTLTSSALLVAAALSYGTVQAHPLEDRILGCSQVQPYLDAAYELRTGGAPIEVVREILVEDAELLPAHRFIISAVVTTLYAIEGEHLPEFEHYRVLSFQVCLTNIGSGFLELTDTGKRLSHHRIEL